MNHTNAEDSFMAHRTGRYADWKILLVLLIIGGMMGGWIGEALIKLWPIPAFLGKYYTIGISPVVVDLHTLSLTLGFTLKLNFFSILGFIIAYFIFRRL